MGSKRVPLPWRLLRQMRQGEEPSSQFSDAVSPLTCPFSLEGTDQSDSNAPLLARTTTSYPFRSPLRSPMLRAFLLLACLFSAVLVIRKHSPHSKIPDTSKIPDATSRYEIVLKCASKLSSPRTHGKPDPTMTKAMNWFLTGAGQDFAISEADCDWNSSFSVLYTLAIVQEALIVTDMSWNANVPFVKRTSDVCKWKRLKCDTNGNIVALTLKHDNVTGTIPEELGQGLVNLTRLYLYSNDGLVGSLPSELGNLKRLEELFLHRTSVTGRIPTELGLLTSLQELLLDNTGLVGSMPNEICKLRSNNLRDLRANCRSTGPVQCEHPACCTSCFS